MGWGGGGEAGAVLKGGDLDYPRSLATWSLGGRQVRGRHLDDLGRLHRVVGSNGHLLSLMALQQVTNIDQSGIIMVQNDEHSYQFA